MTRMGAFVNSRCDALLMGLFFGPTCVGIYRFADRLMDMALLATTRPLTAVSLPHFSHAQDDPTQLKRRYLACMRFAATLTIPLMCLMCATSVRIIAIAGERWAPASHVLMLQCAVGIMQAMALFTGPLMQARSRSHLLASLIWVMAALNTIGLVVAGVIAQRMPSGRQAVIVSLIQLSVFTLIYAPINVCIALRLTGCRLRELIGVIAPAATAGLAGITTVVVIERLQLCVWAGNLLALVVTGSAAAVVMGFVVLLLDANLRDQLRSISSWAPRADALSRGDA